jgi:hypothetical protein
VDHEFETSLEYIVKSGLKSLFKKTQTAKKEKGEDGM